MYKLVTKQLNNYKLIRICVKYQSTNPAIKETVENEDFNNKIKEFENISKIIPKIRTKKPQRAPFVKNFFLGKFDTEFLSYPQLEKEELNNLETSLEPIKIFLNQDEIKNSNKFTLKFAKQIADKQLWGLQVNQLRNCRELTVTESIRFTEEISKIKLKNSVLNNEYLVIQALQLFGNDQQKAKYLQKLIKGEIIAGFCIVENNTDIKDLKKSCTAEKAEDNIQWILNGKNDVVINGSSADFIIAVAQTNIELTNIKKEHQFTVFIIEKDLGGVLTSQHQTNYSDIELSSVVFDNVLLSPNCILGELNKGEDIVKALYPQYRLSSGPICTSIIRDIIKHTTDHFISISHEPYPLYETDVIRERISEWAISLYAAESLIYLTSGIIDNYDQQDVELETTIVKVFTSESALNCTNACLNLLGSQTLKKNHFLNGLHKDSLLNVLLNDNNEDLKLIIALFGLRFAGEKMQDVIKKLRNPLYYAPFVIKKMWMNSKQIDDDPKLNLNLHHYLHPSLIFASQNLEYSILRLQFATETLLSRHGNEIVNKHIDLKRLADCVINIYAMVACLGRASRSYCIGLQHASDEITLTMAFCVAAREKIRKNVKDIYDGHYYTNDENYRRIAKIIFKNHDYFPVHSLSRNF